MRLEQLEYLCEIGKCNNMTKAAETLHVSQPSLSEAIKRLEDELGLQLLERYYNGVHLTDAGKDVVRTAEIIFHQLEQLQCRLQMRKVARQENKESILLETTPFMGNTYLFQFLQQSKKVLDWDLKVDTRDARETITFIKKKKVHAGLILMEDGMQKVLQEDYPELSFLLLKEGKLQVILRKEHPLNQYDIIPVAEFLRYPFLFPKNGCIPVRRMLSVYGSTELYEESNAYTIPGLFSMEGMNTSLLSSVLVNYFKDYPFDNPELVAKTLEVPISANLYLVMRRKYAAQPVGQSFTNFVLEYFEELNR